MNQLFTATVLALVATANAAHAQSKKLPEYITHVGAKVAVAAGGKATVTVKIDVASGWHIWANKPGDPNAIATEISVKAPAGVTIGKPVYPAGHAYPAGGKIYEGPTTVTFPVSLGKVSHAVLNLTIKAQGCNATSCMPPVSLPLTVAIATAPGKN